MKYWTTKQVIGAVAGALGILICLFLFAVAVSGLPDEDQQLIKYQMMGVRPIVIIDQHGGSRP